jgi:hypothetical protein
MEVRKMKWSTITLLVLTVFFGGRLLAADKTGDEPKGGKRADKTQKDKQAKWSVVQVGDELKIIQDDKLKDLRAELEKAAKESKTGKKGGKIEAKTVKMIRGGFATESDAEKFKTEYLDKQKTNKDKGTDKTHGAKGKAKS